MDNLYPPTSEPPGDAEPSFGENLDLRTADESALSTLISNALANDPFSPEAAHRRRWPGRRPGNLVRMSHTHKAVMAWMILNPEKSLADCAAYFGYTQSWLSTLIHSDAFQAELKAAQITVMHQVAGKLTDKLTTLADVALEKLTDAVEQTNDKEFLLDVADRSLHRLGFAPASTRNPAPTQSIGQQNNFVMVTSDDLASARNLMRQIGAAQDVLPAPAETPELPEGKF